MTFVYFLRPKLGAELGWILGVAADVLGLWSRWLAWKASQQLPAEKEQRREWYDAKWRRIRNSSWLRLPEAVIRWLARAKDSFSKRNFASLWGIAVLTSPLVTLTIQWLHILPRYSQDRSGLTDCEHLVSFNLNDKKSLKPHAAQQAVTD